MRVCLVTTGQPSTNPRLVKEADALTDSGFDVAVVGAHWTDWATAADQRLLASRPWTFTFVDWRRNRAPWLFTKSRIRHWAARKLGTTSDWKSAAAVLSRVGPELGEAASRTPAALYIAHNLGALPAAAAAARMHNARLAFDAEDFHSGQLANPEGDPMAETTRTVERQFLPECAYVSAASPGIAESYRDLCGIPLPTCVLNVFPLRDRPPAFRTASNKGLRLYWFSQTIGPDRGLEDAVRAMGVLTNHDIELHLRGKWQAGYEERLRAIAAEAGARQGRIISHEPADADEMVRLAATYDVGLALEPPVTVNNDILLSNKIFTYILGGTAVIATRTRGQAGLVGELGAAALSYETGDHWSFAAALTPWLEDRDALLHARQTAWCLGESRFNWDREKATFLGLVQTALDAPKA